MHAWETIERSLDFIEEHLEEEVKIEALADATALSPFYFQRLFKRLVHKPVQEYIKLRRLARAADALRDTKRRILDVAMDYGFSSHANFTRAFKDAYAITPEEYRRTLPMLNTFDRPEVSANYVLIGEGVPLVVGDIVLEIERKTLIAPETSSGAGIIPNEVLSPQVSMQARSWGCLIPQIPNWEPSSTLQVDCWKMIRPRSQTVWLSGSCPLVSIPCVKWRQKILRY